MSSHHSKMRFIILILSLFLNTIFALPPQPHESSALAVVSFMGEQGLPALARDQQFHHHSGNPKPRNRRMYAMCPPNFQRIGTECYSLPEQRSSWLEAHFFCKDKNARLAEPQKYSDRKLRAFLPQHDARLGLSDPIWIGATYDWNSMIWQWSISGKNLTYDGFNRFDSNQKILNNHCAVYDPSLQYRWSARSCPDKYRFICQHKMPKVSEKNRYKVYDRWNATYPNQLANEVILEVIDRRRKNGTRNNRRVKAVDNNEEIIIPDVRSNRSGRQQRTRPPRPYVQKFPNENDVNYNYQSTTLPNGNNYKEQPLLGNLSQLTRTTTEKVELSTYNEILPPVNVDPITQQINQKRQQRLRTQHDRKLQRQREKEKRRLQNKRDRQERMKQEKQRMRKEREERKRILLEKQKQQQQEQKNEHSRTLDELHQRESNTEQQSQHVEQNRQQSTHLQEQPDFDQRNRELQLLKQQHVADEERERLRQERFRTQHERELVERGQREEAQRRMQVEREIEERKREQERFAEEQKLKEEHETRLKAAQNERERQLKLEQEKKRLQDVENRHRQEDEEKLRQKQIKRQQEEEEKQLELQRLVEAKRLEHGELERLKEENRHREEIQRQRKEEISRREAEQKLIEQEEERLKKEIAEAEKIRLQQHEDQIRQEEEISKAHEEARKRQVNEKEQRRKERFELLKKEEQSHLHEEKKRKYAERLAALPKEDREKFLELRKRRKALKEKQRKGELSEHDE